MKLLSLHVDNFGRLSSFDYSFTDGINQFVFENGYGKTTLVKFITAMFYGLPKYRQGTPVNDRIHYCPFNGGNYGGRISFSLGGNEYEIRRYFDDKSKDDFAVYKDGIETIEFGRNPGLIIFGIDEDAFMRSVFISNDIIFEKGNDSMIEKLGNIVSGGDGKDTDKAIKTIADKIYELDGNRDNASRPLSRARSKLFEAQGANAKIAELNSRNNLLDKKIADLETKQQELIKKSSESNNESVKQMYNEIKSEYDEKKLQYEEVTRNYTELQKQLKEEPKQNYILLGSIFLVGALALAILSVFVGKPVFYGLVVGAGICFVVFVLFMIRAIKKSKIKQDNVYINSRLHQYLQQATNLSDQAGMLLKQLDKIRESAGTSLYSNGSTQNIGEEINRVSAEIQNLKFEKNDNLAQIEKQIELSENIEDYENDVESIVHKIEVCNKATQFINDARDSLKFGYIDPVRLTFDEYCNELSAITGGIVSVNKDLKVDFDCAGVIRSEEFLSLGQKAVVMLCLRLALVRNMFKNEQPFVLMDDPFMSVDGKHFENAKKLIVSLSKDRQILYFTCHESRAIL